MQKALEEKGITPLSAEVEWIPATTVELSEEQAQDVLKLVDKLEQDEDVQKVFHNLKHTYLLLKIFIYFRHPR
jgi:transcriptional/translational regulatory protein YebC/TACO1